MKILLYSINYSPELTGIGKYSGEFARWCAAQGHDVRVITAPAYYPDWKVAKEFSAYRYKKTCEEGVRVTRCPLYVPSQPSAGKRILHLLSFSATSAFSLFANFRWKPDLVVQIAPTLFCCVSTLLFCRLTKAQAVLHIQDYEVDAMFGLSMAKGRRLKKIAFALERMILQRFDYVSTISKGMMDRAIAKGVDPAKVLFFPNWSETERFRDARKDNELLAELGVDPGKKLILYAGSMGEKQGLDSILDAAVSLASRADLQFLLVGDGDAKNGLLGRVRDEKIRNVLFAPLQPYERLPGLLASAACHLVIQKRGAADAVLPSKLTNVLAVGGNAVITADEDTSLGELTRDRPAMACRVEPESVTALVEGIDQALTMPTPNQVARGYALEHLDKDAIIGRFLANFDG